MKEIAQYGYINRYPEPRLLALRKRHLFCWSTARMQEQARKLKEEADAIQTSYDIRLKMALRHKFL
jgi:hypothetical protein